MVRETEQELKGLRDLVLSLSKKKLETRQVSSFQKATPLPTVVDGVDLPRGLSVVQRPARAWQHSPSVMGLLQACLREAASRAEDVQVCQMSPLMEQRDTQGHLVRVHPPRN